MDLLTLFLGGIIAYLGRGGLILNLNATVGKYGASSKHIKDPVRGVEQEEGDGEDHARVFVDDVDVLDLWHGRAQRRRAPAQRRHDARPLARLGVCVAGA